MSIGTISPTRPILRAASTTIPGRGRAPEPVRGTVSAAVRRPRPGAPRRHVLIGATAVALLSTAGAYVAMVAFGVDVLEMSPLSAYAFAGVFELSLVTVALLAREAATQDRPAHTLLALTWALSAASGFFAGWHELNLEHPLPAAGFRVCVPLLAALMWHLVLVGDQHLATGRSWADMRANARMHAMLLTAETWHRARADHAANPTRANARRVEYANRRRLQARAVALRTVDPVDMDRRVAEWSSAMEAVTRGTTTAGKSASDAAPVRGVIKGDTGTLPVTRPVTRPAIAAGAAGIGAVAPSKPAAGTVTSGATDVRRAAVAELLAEGKTGEEIAERVGASLRTVRRDISALQK